MEVSTSKIMADDVYEKLAGLGLESYAAPLADLGVEKLQDLQYLSVEDFASIGLNRVRTRKLQQEAKRKTEEDEEDEDEEEDGFQTSDMKATEGGGHYGHEPEQKLIRSVSSIKRRQSSWWQGQSRGRPMRVVFIRHGESEANVDREITKTVPDHMLHLTARGREQALDAGKRLRDLLGDESVKFVVSPWIRTRETLNGILQAFPPMPKVREDVRIREQEYGNYDAEDIRTKMKEKKKFGPFYYRFADGESPADCYDRASGFLESQYRSWEDNTARNEVIVSHGMMLLVMFMRMFRVPISEFTNLDALKNCEFIVLERPPDDGKFAIAYVWPPGEEKDYTGLRRKPVTGEYAIPVWDGNPEAPLLKNQPVKE